MIAILIGYLLIVVGLSTSMYMAFGWLGLSVAVAMIGAVFIFTAPLLDILMWERSLLQSRPPAIPKQED